MTALYQDKKLPDLLDHSFSVYYSPILLHSGSACSVERGCEASEQYYCSEAQKVFIVIGLL